MAVEIERKFLVVGDEWREHVQRSQRLVQGYLTPGRSPSAAEAMDGRERPLADSPGAGCSVRVRTAGESAWLNVKSAVTGIERREYEYAIPLADAECMLEEFCAAVIKKIRHYVPCAGVMFEVDEFLGDNDGLVVAEIELQSVGEEFPRPAWLGREVSDRPRYYNLHLLQHPYSRWNARERAGD
ncbi:MAG TPA: CYTH domain-containing protein [Rudaea sp.]|nr:CYTH domain-containing protein [Rudaea sp.]